MNMSQLNKKLEVYVNIYESGCLYLPIETLLEDIVHLEQELNKCESPTRSYANSIVKLTDLKKKIEGTIKQIQIFDKAACKLIDTMGTVMYSFDVYQTPEEGLKYFENIKYIGQKGCKLYKKTPKIVMECATLYKRKSVTNLQKTMEEDVSWSKQYLLDRNKKLTQKTEEVEDKDDYMY